MQGSTPIVVQGTPVVVQGTPVSSYPQSSQPHYPQSSGINGTQMSSGSPSGGGSPEEWNGHGVKQETRCRDPIFAVLFYINVIAILAVAVVYGPNALENATESTGQDANDNSKTDVSDYTGYMYTMVVCSFLSAILAALSLGVMMAIPETLIKISLIFVIAMGLAVCILAFASGSIFAGVLGAIFFLISLCYARAVWPRIPFASANLVTAVTAIRKNFGVVAYAYIFTLLGLAWSIMWAFAFIGSVDSTYSCDANNVCTNPKYGMIFVLFLAYFFTQQVIQVCPFLFFITWLAAASFSRFAMFVLEFGSCDNGRHSWYLVV
jgi:Plasma-membrane choline transporter